MPNECEVPRTIRQDGTGPLGPFDPAFRGTLSLSKSFRGTQWQAGCEQRNARSYCASWAHLSRLSGTGHLPVKVQIESFFDTWHSTNRFCLQPCLWMTKSG